MMVPVGRNLNIHQKGNGYANSDIPVTWHTTQQENEQTQN